MRTASTKWFLAAALLLTSHTVVRAQFGTLGRMGGMGGMGMGMGGMGMGGMGMGGMGMGGMGGPGSYPVFSPYLNLLRGDQSVLLNYWGLVQPQLAFQQDIAGLQQGLAMNQGGQNQMMSMMQNGGYMSYLPPTGAVAAGFQNHRLFFMTHLRGMGGGGGMGMGMGGMGMGMGGMGMGMGGMGMGMGGMGMGMGGMGMGMGGMGMGMGGMGMGMGGMGMGMGGMGMGMGGYGGR